jgi:signal transduction histidine kinase
MDFKLIILSVIIVVLTFLGVAIIINLVFKKKKSKADFRSFSAQLIAFAVWISILANLFVPEHNLENNTRIGVIIFFTSVIVGIFLIRSIFREIEIERTVEQLIDKLKENNEDLKKLEQQKTEFVSVASHQLRGPISAIIGHISMMLEGDYGNLPQEFKEPTERVLKSSKSLSILVNDFLNVSRIEKGKLEYLIEDFDILTLLSSLLPDFTKDAKEKGITLEKKCDAEGIIARGDINKTRQIFSNILENAIKYTPKGGIIIDCETTVDNITISIKDTGIGLSKDFGDQIFQKFVRDEEAIKLDVSGTGLGLYVATVMITAMNGKIWAESEGKDKGSTFYIKMPLSKG